MCTVDVSKIALRKEIAERISQLSLEEKRRQSQIVYEKLTNLPAYKTSERVSIYLSTPDEIDTDSLVKKIFEQEKKCYVPRAFRIPFPELRSKVARIGLHKNDHTVVTRYDKQGMQMVLLRSLEDFQNLPRNNWNIRQPSLKEKREDALETGGLDLVICPGVAFTKSGLRLGHGGGYYDKYLAKLKEIQETPPATVGLAFNEQIVEKIPASLTDYVIDLVLQAE